MVINPATAAIFSSVISGGFSLFGQSQADSAARRQAYLANKQAMQDWRYDNKTRKLTNRYNIRNWQNEINNQNMLLDYQDRLAIREYNFGVAQQKHEYETAMRAYAQSEQNYKLQLQFNNIAAGQAYEAEREKLREVKIGAAFQSQDMMVENVQEEGAAAARGQSGRSAGKAVQSAAASYGRNVAILEESMKSAERQTLSNFEKIRVEKLGADLAAEAARMLRPERGPSLPRPEPLPRANIIKPLRIPFKKKPVGISAGTSSAGYLSTIGNMFGNVASAYIGNIGKGG